MTTTAEDEIEQMAIAIWRQFAKRASLGGHVDDSKWLRLKDQVREDYRAEAKAARDALGAIRRVVR